MAYRKKRKSPLKRIGDALFFVSAAISRLFDNSLTARLTKAVRHTAATLSARALGVFFLSFGIYSFLFSLLTDLFTEREVFASSLYGGLILAVGFVPLLFSRGNVSTILSESRAGRLLSGYLAVNRNSLDTGSFSGHLGRAFILGLIAGAVTQVFPLSSVLALAALLLMSGIILAIPETGMFFITLLLFTAETSMLHVVTAVIIFSYGLKLIRRKRKLRFKKADGALLIFCAYSALSALLTSGSDPSVSNLRYCAYVIPYFLCISLLRDRDRIVKIINTAVYTLGFVCVLYVLGFIANEFFPIGAVADRGYLLRAVLDMPIVKSGVLPFACASVAPVCLAFTLRPYEKGPRMLYGLLLCAMLATLVIAEKLEFALAAVAVCVLFLLTTGTRKIYLFVSVGLCGVTAFTYSDVLFGKVFRFTLRQLNDIFDTVRKLSEDTGIALSEKYLLCGQGYATAPAASGSFYVSLISFLGIAGFVILFGFILLVCAEAAIILIKSHRRKKAGDGDRFKGLASNNEIRMYAVGLMFSMLSSLVCAVFYNIHASDTAYIMLFLSCGIATAYLRSVRAELSQSEGCTNANSSGDRATAVL